MVKHNSRIGQRHWQLVICLTLAQLGSIASLKAQWFSPSPQVDTPKPVGISTDVLAVADDVIAVAYDSAIVNELVYQGPVFIDSLHRRVNLVDFSNTQFRTQASEFLFTLIKTDDLSRFDVVYLPWHRIQIVLMQQYLRYPDSLHMDYLRVSWKEDIEFPESLFLALRDFQKKTGRFGKDSI